VRVNWATPRSFGTEGASRHGPKRACPPWGGCQWLCCI